MASCLRGPADAGRGVRVLRRRPAKGGLAFVHATGALLGVGFGFLLRRTAGALVSVIALILALPPTSAHLTLAAWAASAIAVGGWRLLRTDAA